jgi:probable addiction module antidote protein
MGDLAMALKTTKWDASKYLDSAEAVSAYIEAALEDGDPALIALALRDVARSKVMSKVVKKAGISREGIYETLKDDPKLTTFLGVMKSLGLQITVRAA